MTVFLAGSEVEILSSFNGSITTASTVAVSGVNRAGFQFNTSETAFADFAAQTEGWFHFRFSRGGPTTSIAASRVPVASLRNATNVPLVSIMGDANELGVYVRFLAGADILLPAKTTRDFDIHFRIDGATGFVRLFDDQVLVQEFTGNTLLGSGAESVSRFFMSAPTTGSGNPYTQFSQLLSSDAPTLGARVHTLALSAGSANGWSGTAADVNDTSNTPLTAISANANNDEILMAAGDMSGLLSGNSITALVLSTAAQAVTGSPVSNLAGRVKLGATTYDMGAAVALTDGFRRVQHVLALNPETSTAWQVADVNGAEIGLQART